jgi:hypothetical protein
MKDQDQNLAVAKFHGWEEIKHNPKTGLWYGKPPKDAAHPWDVVVPDYGKDLNAIHKAFKTIKQCWSATKEWGGYSCRIYAKSRSNDTFVTGNDMAQVMVEAFLRFHQAWPE